MRKSERLASKLPIDYKSLHKSGEKSIKVVSDSESSNLSGSSTFQDSKMDQSKNSQFIAVEYQSVSADISDFIDENLVDDSWSLEELNQTLQRIEDFRSAYRSLNIQIKDQDNYDETADKDFQVKIKHIKQFILHVKDVKQTFRLKHREVKIAISQTTQRTNQFIVQNVRKEIDTLQVEMSTNISNSTDAEITRRNTETSEMRKRLGDVENKLKELLQQEFYGDVMDELRERYEKLLSTHQSYLIKLRLETDNRDIEKYKLLMESNLKIDLLKFKGYDSPNDFYTFKKNFEKLHLRTTPKHLLSDLLKNNYLDETALSLVKNLDNVDDIWKRLKDAFGDPQMMLQKKLDDISNLHLALKVKDHEKTISSLSKLISIIKDLISLSKQHRIESRLYNSNALERIFVQIGEAQITRWLSYSYNEERLEGEQLWLKFVSFLEKEMRIHHERLLIQRKTEEPTGKQHQQRDNSKNLQPRKLQSHIAALGEEVGNDSSSPSCSFCGDQNHVATNGPGTSKIIQYYSCKRFVEMTPHDRFSELRSKGFCFQCLYPGAIAMRGKHSEGRCQHDFVCQHESHDRFPTKKHVLVCDEHKHLPQNQELLQRYKTRYILNQKSVKLPNFSKDINIHQLTLQKSYPARTSSSTIENSAIYQLQEITVNNQGFLLFFDTGCSDFVSRYDAIQKLQNNVKLEYPGPINIGGVGDTTIQSQHGIYSVSLPLHNNHEATFTGICLEKVTATFPTHQLTKVESDIHKEFKKCGGDINELPRLPRSIGGDVDFMIGIKYLRYHPHQVFQLPSGLIIYQSMFKNSDGSRGIIGGPHKIFNQIANHIGIKNQVNFVINQLKVYQIGYQLNPDVSILGYKDDNTNAQLENKEINHESYATKAERHFKESEAAGSIISYRCIKCRSCKTCKEHVESDAISIQEEIEQDLINKSVTVDIENRVTIASLPLLHNPIIKLAPNRNNARKVYQQQLHKLNKHPKDKTDVIESENKLQLLGHVDYVRNLSPTLQKMLQTNQVQNFIPWRAVWKTNSMSTPCRVVFDASQPTKSGFSLNNIIAKGRNNMNKLVEIVIRWSLHKVGYHTDVRKMYNAVKLIEDHWCLQRYLWQNELDPTKPPEEKVIKTLIYGVKSSGNQAERALRETSNQSKDEYPRVHEVISKDVYVDDCISGENTIEDAMKRADELEIVLIKGGFSLKGFTFSGHDPSDTLSYDGKSISVAGMLWFPKPDQLSLDISELNFAKKQRGKKPIDSFTGTMPINLTRRHCTSKVSEVFDFTGKVTPITAAMKLDLHDLVTRKLQWDDVIPDTMRPIWESHFQMMQEIKEIKFSRTVIPEDAANLDINTLDFGDASISIACAAIYTRVLRKSGGFSSQLVFSRSKLVSSPTTQPRAELIAAVLNVHTGEVVKRAYQQFHKGCLKLTDSQIVLHWICNEEKALKQWVMNRVIEIQRFTDVNDWRYINTSNMLADIGTRKGATISDVSQNSRWINGEPWMKLEESQFPVKTVGQIILTFFDLQEVDKESQVKKTDIQGSVSTNSNANCNVASNNNSNVPVELKRRYAFSNYVIDPNKFHFKKVIRILAIVKRFIQFLRKSLHSSKATINNTKDVECTKKHLTIFLTDDEIKEAENYFFQKATLEVKHFLKKSQYDKISEEINGILYYSGRLLPTEKINIITPMSAVMHDLQSTSFFVPITDKNSPLAHSIVNEVHWYDNTVKHSGNESIWRFTLKKVYIIEGRELVKKIKHNCKKCRHLMKKLISVEMGKVSECNLTIAPAFYNSQVDLAGPFKSYCNHHRRSTIKIWMTVFCCMTTSATSIKIMDDYSATAFVQAFTRFACQFGYPKKLQIDSGSQLIKGCESMRLNFHDLQFKLHHDVSVNFEICPVGAHNVNGKVERKIKEITRSLERTLSGQRLSTIQWETVSSEISNCINNMPLALGNIVSDFESMDLITPNRLILGRNNDRSPIGSIQLPNDANKMIETNNEIFNCWFENWLVSHVPKLMHQPKWFSTDTDLKEGDIVLFLKNDTILSKHYQFGMIRHLYIGNDNRIRKAKVIYQNHNENTKRETFRSVRELVVIHHVDEIDIMDNLNELYASN